MYPAQNLIAIAYAICHGTSRETIVHVDLRVLDGDGIHPETAGQTLFLPTAAAQCVESAIAQSQLKGLGKHIALLRYSMDYMYGTAGSTTYRFRWWLQLWDWQQSTTSNSNLRDRIFSNAYMPVDFCFIGNDRLLIAGDDLKLYSIEDVSQAPQLLACYLLPISVSYRQCLLRDDDIGRVVREPSTIKIPELGEFTTSLPYVEVTSNRVFAANELIKMWLDKDRIYLAQMMDPPVDNVLHLIVDRVEIIEM
ncbi:hypothetical protein EDB19DRAFT_1683078 [Suillus lakei]|nr:hypothetical protein EDB19DRAFT_1683078 [Suillus lakei]